MSACNILYGKYPVESTSFKNNLKSNTPSIILAAIISMLIQYKSAEVKAKLNQPVLNENFLFPKKLATP